MRNRLTMLAALLLAATPALAAGTLTYRGTVGQVAEYRVTTRAVGEQISLGQRRPINVETEYEVREEVLACGADGSLHLQVTGRAVQVKDATHAFNGQRLDLPPLQVHVSARGEILSAGAATPGGAGMQANAAAALLAQSLPMILPPGPVEPGGLWQWERSGASQENRLVEIAGEGPRIARITGTARAPIAFQERSEALGLTSDLTGTEAQTSTLDLSLDSGVTLRHKGILSLQTKTEVKMESSEGSRSFAIELRLRVDFDSRLVKLDGKPV